MKVIRCIETVLLAVLLASCGTRQTDAYRLEVNGRNVKIYDCRVSGVPINQVWPGYQRPLEQTDTAYFAIWEMPQQGPAQVEIVADHEIRQARVVPESAGIEPLVSGHRIRFTMETPRNIVVEVDGVRRALHLFANQALKNTPDPEEPGVHYYGPGFHDAGIVRLESGDRVYLAPGAVVSGGFYAVNARDISISGHGIINQSRYERGSGSIVGFSGCKNIRVEDVVLQDASMWCCTFFGCDSVEVDNVKIIGQWRYNSDGIDVVNSSRVRIRNCFVRSFLSKWLVDLDDAQRSYGAYPSYAPYPYAIAMEYAPGWMDAGVIVPWTLWQVYGDCRVLQRMYPGMKRFLSFYEQSASEDLQPPIPTFGDWLAVGKTASDDFIANAYYAYDADLMSQMAGALGARQDSVHYASLAARIRSAFAKRYIAPDGTLRGNDCQTAYALALYFGLYPTTLAQAAADRLADMIVRNGGRFTTGFLGTKHVMMVLSQYGYDELAYDLLLQPDYPGWGYSILNGATSIWERWDSYTREYGFGGRSGENNARMNSFSHYAFGSVAEWLFRYALGIETASPGFRHIILAPHPDSRIGWMKGSYRSICGTIESEWRVGRQKTVYRFLIPPNTRATLRLPGQKPQSLWPGEYEFELKNTKS